MYNGKANVKQQTQQLKTSKLSRDTLPKMKCQISNEDGNALILLKRQEINASK